MANRILKPDSSNNLILQDGDSVSRVTLNAGGTSVLSDEGGTSALSIQADGDIDIAENIYLASGKGIYFDGGTTSDNYLGGADAYEVGTWTPAEGGSWASWSGTTTGTYMRIGDSVTVWGQLGSGTFDPGSTSVYISGLPFSNTGIQGVGPVSKTASLAAVFGNLLASGTTLYPDVDWGAQTDIKFTVSYYFG